MSKKQGNGIIETKVELYPIKASSHIFVVKCQLWPRFRIRNSTVAAVEISDTKDLNTLYKFRNLISVNRIFIKDYKVSVNFDILGQNRV
jgi:hypothetical protein